MRSKFLFGLSLAFLAVGGVAHAAPGDLDTTFNGTGKRSMAPTSGDVWNHAQAMAVQGGRLVVLGGYHPTTTSVNLAWLARLRMSLIFGDDFDAGHRALWSSAVP